MKNKRLIVTTVCLALILAFSVLLFACNKNDAVESEKSDIVIDSYSGGKNIKWNMVNEDENGLAYLMQEICL